MDQLSHAQEEPIGTNNNSDVFLAPPDVPAAPIATHAIHAASDSSLKQEILSAKKSVVMVLNSFQTVMMETTLMEMVAAALVKLNKDGPVTEDLLKEKINALKDFPQSSP